MNLKNGSDEDEHDEPDDDVPSLQGPGREPEPPDHVAATYHPYTVNTVFKRYNLGEKIN